MAGHLERHLGPRAADTAAMCQTLGVTSPESLLDRALPSGLPRTERLGIAGPWDETEAERALRAIAAKNRVTTAMIGLGFHDTVTPAVLTRSILLSPSWYTAYTPYQPEISQGRLEALLTFQTMIADLTGLPIAGASLLDEASAAMEAVTLSARVWRGPQRRYGVDIDALPQTRAVLAHRAEVLGIELVDVDPERPDAVPEGLMGALVQYPGASGRVIDLAPIAARLHDAGGGLLAVAADPLALVLLPSPGSRGADICLGTTQRFGMPMAFGGPHAAFLAVRAGLERQLPGRLVGISHDAAGNPALRLAWQTREQHIRREKATSNICTAQVLPAIVAAMYAVWHGPEGLRDIARRVNARARDLADALDQLELEVGPAHFFDTLSVRVPGHARAWGEATRRRGITIGVADADTVRIACNETTTHDHLADIVAAALEALPAGLTPGRQGSEGEADGVRALSRWEAPAERHDPILRAEVFHAYHSETAMMRYLKRLSDRDYALDRGMIPLGSCTMKLNPAAAMAPLTWEEFGRIHPFAPVEDVAGYRELIEGLEQDLARITGYDAASVQPNAGSQGELAGLLAIRGYHRARGEGERDICLIPTSAHGTNAASAVLAGLRVVPVACDEHGAIQVEDLQERLREHGGQVAAIMVTYPSTYGVYDASIQQICEAVHAAGGQVYIDGANLNALAGVVGPGACGGDVSHLNLHKTFAIPHGGGGPGVGPVVAAAHLEPHLPGHPLAPWGRTTNPIAAAPFGSPGVLAISWTYLRLLGPQGLAAATASAVLAANYLAHELRDVYPVRYTGPGGWVAHECILDVAEVLAGTGLTIDDVAKRLIDYGFHAPTMSFPVPGTFMVEPTESETREELDRFVAAMRAIASEIEAVREGRVSCEASALRGAPHTVRALAGQWDRDYTRAEAAFPPGTDPVGKYFSPVSRIDGAAGDRRLVARWPEPDER